MKFASNAKRASEINTHNRTYLFSKQKPWNKPCTHLLNCVSCTYVRAMRHQVLRVFETHYVYVYLHHFCFIHCNLDV